MTITEPSVLARQILGDMDTAFRTNDADLIKARFADDVVFLGSAATCLGKAHASAYIDASVGHIDRMVWDYGQTWTFDRHDGHQALVAIGEMHLPDGRRSPYRLTLVLDRYGDEWKIVHFHGSTVPE